MATKLGWNVHKTFSALDCRSQVLSMHRLNHRRKKSTFATRFPSRFAQREVPTPLAFLSASSWDASSDMGSMSSFATQFAEKGFTCIESDLSLPEGQIVNSDALMDHFQADLKDYLRSTGIPFPPVIFARSAVALVAQAYVSSNPATGLFLISPPLNNTNSATRLLPTPLKEFDFELTFPIAIMGTAIQMDALANGSRLAMNPRVDKIVVKSSTGQEAFIKIEEWLDALGI